MRKRPTKSDIEAFRASTPTIPDCRLLIDRKNVNQGLFGRTPNSMEASRGAPIWPLSPAALKAPCLPRLVLRLDWVSGQTLRSRRRPSSNRCS